MGNKLSSSCIIHGEEEGLPRGLSRVTFVPLSYTLPHMNAARVSVLDRSCRSGAVNHACTAWQTTDWLKNLARRRSLPEEACQQFSMFVLAKRMGDAEEVDISAVGNLLLHGDARDTSSSRFVGVSDARRASWRTPGGKRI